MLFRSVTAGSNTANWARTGHTTRSARAIAKKTARLMVLDIEFSVDPARPFLRLSPCAECVTRSGRERVVRRSPIAPRGQLHVDGRSLRVPFTLVSSQQLLQRVRQQLIRGHVLAPLQQLAG